jgi:hypothetical protein
VVDSAAVQQVRPQGVDLARSSMQIARDGKAQDDSSVRRILSNGAPAILLGVLGVAGSDWAVRSWSAFTAEPGVLADAILARGPLRRLGGPDRKCQRSQGVGSSRGRRRHVDGAPGPFSVGSFYARFDQTSDREVIGYLTRSRLIPSGARSAAVVTALSTPNVPIQRSS